MKFYKKISLTLLVIANTSVAQAQVPALSSEASNVCGGSWACDNPNWVSIPIINKHVENALFLGGHNGTVRRSSNTQGVIRDIHCSDDQLYNNLEAANRNLWSLKCAYETKRNIAGKFLELDFETYELITKSNVYFPIFVVPQNTSVAHYIGRRNMDYRAEPCDLPVDAYIHSWCEAGCFAGDQEFPYVVKEISKITEFKDAPLDQTIKIYSLSSDSNLDNLATHQADAIAIHTSENSPLKERVFEVYVESKEKPALRVSGNHPIVNENGEIIMAVDLKPGDEILTLTGSQKVIASKEVSFDGDMYNILPSANSLTENIFVVGDGYLVGSKRIQDKKLSNFSRAFLRENLTVD